MKKILFISLFTVFALALEAQTDPDTSWKTEGFIGVNFSQVNLSQWTSGGENALSLTSKLSFAANYAKDKTEWSNSIDLAYAINKSGQDDIRKNDDKIELNSKYSRKIVDHWLYSILLNFKSQFANGYLYPDDSNVVSKFMAPGYLTISPGITYKPVEYLEIMVSPATGKFTFVMDNTLSDAGAYGVDSGKTTKFEFGAYLNIHFKKDIMENVTLTSKFELFQNYGGEGKSKNADVNWDSSLDMKINKYLTASINAVVIYDADVIERTQFKEVFGIGLGYKF